MKIKSIIMLCASLAKATEEMICKPAYFGYVVTKNGKLSYLTELIPENDEIIGLYLGDGWILGRCDAVGIISHDQAQDYAKSIQKSIKTKLSFTVSLGQEDVWSFISDFFEQINICLTENEMEELQADAYWCSNNKSNAINCNSSLQDEILFARGRYLLKVDFNDLEVL